MMIYSFYLSLIPSCGWTLGTKELAWSISWPDALWCHLSFLRVVCCFSSATLTVSSYLASFLCFATGKSRMVWHSGTGLLGLSWKPKIYNTSWMASCSVIIFHIKLFLLASGGRLIRWIYCSQYCTGVQEDLTNAFLGQAIQKSLSNWAWNDPVKAQVHSENLK